MEVEHWNDIGYHFGIEQIEESYQVLVGRPLTQVGAHCYQEEMNSKAIGIMFCGNFDETIPSTKMLKVAVHGIVAPMMKIFNIPVSNLMKHSDFAIYKSCPGSKFNWLDFTDLVQEELSVT